MAERGISLPNVTAADPTDAPTPTPDGRVLIIGAGITGLTAAGRLTEAGRRVLIVDKGRSVGGRLATRRLEGALLDHGAQFFTTRSDAFTSAVAGWVDDGVVAEWCRGFGTDDGYPRYRTEGGMNRLAKHLAGRLDPALAQIVTRVRVQALHQLPEGWVATYEAARREGDDASAVIATSPVPQTLDYLADGAVRFDPAVDAERVRALAYHPVIALLTLVDGVPDLGPAGALQLPDDPTFTFIADNKAKGISDVRAVTFHCAHDRSAELWSLDDAAIAAALLPPASERLGSARIIEHQVKKWRYAGPVEPWPDRCLTLASSPGPLVLAGDAFGGPKVEGAYLSGLAAADAVLAAS